MSYGDDWALRPAPALHGEERWLEGNARDGGLVSVAKHLTIKTSGRGRHDENDIAIAQRLVDVDARLAALEAQVGQPVHRNAPVEQNDDASEWPRSMPKRPLMGEGELAWRTYALELEKALAAE